jgi:RimJ/RimL family protein N-acetyltransferase
MNRKIYIKNSQLSLSEYIADLDDLDNYYCWQEPETQKGYNYKRTDPFKEFTIDSIKSRFIATIIRYSDSACIGSIFVSPMNTLPDLAIMIYKPYRNQGYGTIAFSLGTQYCFETLKLDKLFAGCYEDNLVSMKMLEKSGFQPHPEGNQYEKHYMTGENIVQFDYVKYNTSSSIEPGNCRIDVKGK